MKKVLCAMMLFAAAILCLHQNVSAAEGATVTVNGDTLQAGSDAWKVTLDISGDTKITNGKIRVTYDSSQLKLVSTEAVILFIHADNLFQRHFGLYHDSGKDAAGKITAIGDEIDVRIETVLELFERLLDFGYVLVLESLVHTQVVVAPAEVARSSRLDARTGAAGDGIHHNIAVQHQMLGKRKQAQLDAKNFPMP